MKKKKGATDTGNTRIDSSKPYAIQQMNTRVDRMTDEKMLVPSLAFFDMADVTVCVCRKYAACDQPPQESFIYLRVSKPHATPTAQLRRFQLLATVAEEPVAVAPVLLSVHVFPSVTVDACCSCIMRQLRSPNDSVSPVSQIWGEKS